MTEKEKSTLLYLINSYTINKRQQLNNAKKRSPETTNKNDIKRHYKYINNLNNKINDLLSLYDKISAF